MRTFKATISVFLVTLVTMAGIYWVTKLAAGGQVFLPRRISASAVCPVAGCSARACHGPAAAPTIEPGQTMTCPRLGCEAAKCHAQDRLTTHYNTPKGASLDLWVLGLSVFTIAMVLIALYL